MSSAAAHNTAGLLAGLVTAILDQSPDEERLLLGGLLTAGAIAGAKLPDVLEPAIHSHHRALFHSFVVLFGAGWAAKKLILDEFVLWLGSHLEFAGQAIDLKYENHRAVLGAVNIDSYNYLLAAIAQSPWFAGKAAKVLSGAWPFVQCTLTPSGWARYRELSLSKVASRYGFMAMKYNDPELDGIVRDWFVPAVRAVGFDLRRLDSGQAAGLIDDQLRVAIRTSRFLVCDLTHGNRGAYWEAGYAEGLGRPVIYTCRADVFDDKNHVNHPHFDTGHLVTIPWSPTDPGTAAAKLKATIRATLPAEATLVD